MQEKVHLLLLQGVFAAAAASCTSQFKCYSVREGEHTYRPPIWDLIINRPDPVGSSLSIPQFWCRCAVSLLPDVDSLFRALGTSPSRDLVLGNSGTSCDSRDVHAEEIIVCEWDAETPLQAELKPLGRHSIDQKSGLWTSMDKGTWWHSGVVFLCLRPLLSFVFFELQASNPPIPQGAGFQQGSWCYCAFWGWFLHLLL